MERIVEGEYEYSSKIALKNTKKAIQGQYLANNHYGNQTFTLKAFQIVVHRKETYISNSSTMIQQNLLKFVEQWFCTVSILDN